MRLAEFTPAFLRQWRDQLSHQYAPATVHRILDSLSGPLTVAVQDYEWLAENPLRKVRKPPAMAGRARFLSAEER